MSVASPKSLDQAVTYSAAYTLVPTYECFNRCDYCNFRVDIGKGQWLSMDAAARQLNHARQHGVIEILILSGEVHPESSQRSQWFTRIYDLCCLALEYGFLPHTNVGPLHFQEMERLKDVNVSMGLMLEQLTPTLLETVHRHAPSKRPARRLQQLEWAGQLKIPFTTGLLLGLGETEHDWCDSLNAIAQLHEQYGHIQEVILQPHSLGQEQLWQGESFVMERLPDVVALARSILPDDIALQIPPNLVTDFELLLRCLDAGASDLGGIGPTDEVNPDYPHPCDEELRDKLAIAGWLLHLRLPVYPQYESWLSSDLQPLLRRWKQQISMV